MPNISGRIITAAIWNSSVLENEIAAETKPLLSAVKKDDAKILKPEIKKDIENSLKPLQVKSKSSLSYPTNIFERGDASIKAAAVKNTPETATIIRLFFSKPFNSL